MPTLLVDGHNFLHARQSGLGEEARDQLLRDAAVYATTWRAKVVVVFDAHAGSGTRTTRYPGVDVVYARGSADDAILATLTRAKRPREFKVVTADRELRQQALALGATVADHDEVFRRPKHRKPSPPASGKPSPSRTEVEYWAEKFKQRKKDEEW